MLSVGKISPNPFPYINPTNPSSWYQGITGFVSGLQGAFAGVEGEITDGIINGDPKFDPQAAIHKKFQICALLGKMYDLLEAVVEMQKQNKKAEKDTFELARAA